MIRPRQKSDLHDLVAALQSVHSSDAYPLIWPQDPQAFLDPLGTLNAWVALHNGALAGQVVLRTLSDPLPEWASSTGLRSDQLAVISRLYLISGARSQGLAERLFRRAWEAAQALQRRAILDVHEKNVAAIRLYERLNWLRVAELPAPWPEPDGHSATAFVYVAPY